MTHTPYVLASLVAAGLMLIEHRACRRRGRPSYRFATTIENIGVYSGELVLTALLHLNVFAAYEVLLRHIALFQPEVSWALALVTLLAVDLIYYAAHRIHHRVGVLWALHAVHHQSRDYNIAAGLRGPWLSAFQIVPFALPLALCGVPLKVLLPVYALHTAYKMVVHTHLIDTLGPLEAVLVSPSQHRVHHGSNAHYIDKNFGGMFSFWDRLLGTYQPEDERVVIGPAEPAQTQDPLLLNLAPWKALARRVRMASGVTGKLVALLGPPVDEAMVGAAASTNHAGFGDAASTAAGNAVSTAAGNAPIAGLRGTRLLRDGEALLDDGGAVPLSRARRWYLTAQTAIAAIAAMGLLAAAGQLQTIWLWAAGAWVLLSLSAVAAMVRGQDKLMRFEAMRMACGAALLLVVWPL